MNVRLDTLGLTSIGAPIGADVSEVDDMFLVESLDKGSKLVPGDPPYRHYKCAYPRRRDGYQRVEAHGGIGLDRFRRLQGATVCAFDIDIAVWGWEQARRSQPERRARVHHGGHRCGNQTGSPGD